jgi:hypothetical protein
VFGSKTNNGTCLINDSGWKTLFFIVPFLDIQYFFRSVSFRFSNNIVSFRSVSDFFCFVSLIVKCI